MKLLYLAIALLTAAHIWFYQRILRPLRRVALQAQGLSSGDFMALEKSYGCTRN